MMESLILWTILGCCALYVVNKFYRAIRSAINPKADMACGCGCSGCSVSNCEDQSK